MFKGISLLDLISLALIAFLGVKGIFRGFVKETFGLIGIIGGIYVASRFAQSVGEYLDTNLFHLQNKNSLYLIGFIATLIAFWLLAVLVGSAIGKLVNSSGLGIVDRILGFFVGGAKVFMIFSVIIYVLHSIPIFNASIDNIFKGSMMYPYFESMGAKIVQFDPSKLKTDNSQEDYEE